MKWQFTSNIARIAGKGRTPATAFAEVAGIPFNAFNNGCFIFFEITNLPPIQEITFSAGLLLKG